MAVVASSIMPRPLGRGRGSGRAFIMLSLASLFVVGVMACGSQPAPSNGESGVAPGEPSARQGLTRTDGGQGGVTFVATPAEASDLTARGYPSDYWGFVVQLDTHAGDLMALDVAKLAAFRDSNGREFKPIAWQGLKEDSHHRSGLLLFSSRDTGIKPAYTQSPEPLELVLYDVAGVKERVLRWD
jgi:hypothetical protein